MGSYSFETTRATYQKDKMSYTTTTYTYSSEASTNRSEFEMMCDALHVDRARFKREFLAIEPYNLSSNYYPRFKQTGLCNTGSPFVTYYPRPYFNYNVPSKYGFSKFITVQKL